MKIRCLWLDRIYKLWRKVPIVWLSGVRRVGKTTLARMLPNAVYMNCDLPSTLRTLEDPELFYENLPQNTILVFDEIHRLPDPSQVLKIGADVYSHLRILATGSSTLAATHKFSDTITGRKRTLHLMPVLWRECISDFGLPYLNQRLFQGGLPGRLLDDEPDPDFYEEWLDSFYARDILELFKIRNRQGFMKLLNLLLRQSGGTVSFSNLAKLSGMSRPTVMSYVEAMSIAHAVFLLKPFHGGGRRELTKAPKAYAFDTGFVAHAKGWHELRDEDRGLLWEHLVLDTLRWAYGDAKVHYWHDKSQREIDFVVPRQNGYVNTFECKINPDSFSPKSLKEFRRLYPHGENWVVSPFIRHAYRKMFGDIEVQFKALEYLSLPNL